MLLGAGAGAVLVTTTVAGPARAVAVSKRSVIRALAQVTRVRRATSSKAVAHARVERLAAGTDRAAVARKDAVVDG